MSDNDPIPRFLTRDEAEAMARVIDAPHSTPITKLVEITGMSRQRAFRWASLRSTRFGPRDDLMGYDFTGADLTDADLRGADFRYATGLDTAILTGAQADASTQWPAGLRPLGTMVPIPAGTFMMGTTKTEHRREKLSGVWDGADELPRHKVTFAQGFLLGRYPVTVGEFRRFVQATSRDMPKDAFTYVEGKGFQQSETADWANPGFAQDDTHPVTCVSHGDASAYADWLARETGKRYRLPNEAEWEYACRAGTTTARFWGDDRERAALYANVADLSCAAALKMNPDPEQFFQHDDGFPFTALVGSFRPNPWGLYDMLGNVWEWCEDHYAENYKDASDNGTVYTTPDSSAARVLRGAAWVNDPGNVRAGSRVGGDPGSRNTDTGFRLARTLCAS